MEKNIAELENSISKSSEETKVIEKQEMNQEIEEFLAYEEEIARENAKNAERIKRAVEKHKELERRYNEIVRMQNELHSKEDQTCHSSQEENMEDLNE